VIALGELPECDGLIVHMLVVERRRSGDRHDAIRVSVAALVVRARECA
jgi:hypothetical protein